MNVGRETVLALAYAYREVENGEKLLAEIAEALDRYRAPDIRDEFGRPQSGLQLGVPSGNNGHRLFNVPWALARPIIETHIAQQKAIIATLSERARIEASGGGE